MPFKKIGLFLTVKPINKTLAFKMQLKEILFKEEIAQTLPVLQQIYSNLDETHYIEEVLNMINSGYKMAGIFENEKCIGVIGIRIINRISLKKTIEIEDFMIDRKKRGIGVGKMLLKWVDWQALNYNCNNIIANLSTPRKESQAIFTRENYLIDGYYMKKST